MNVDELKKELIRQGIPKDFYALKGGLPNEAYCLDYSHNQWHVYYSERGRKTGMKSFEKENDACKYMLSKLENTKI